MEIKIEDFKKEKYEDNLWYLANNIIYKACEEMIDHKEKSNIIAKVWLIGRTYAAQIERRKRKEEEKKKFYEEIVCNKIYEEYVNIDKMISKLKEYEEIKDTNIMEIICFHKEMVDIFYDITNMHNRSFVSKYLHFHLPKLYYIYDSRAKEELDEKVDIESQEYKEYKEEYEQKYKEELDKKVDIESQEYKENIKIEYDEEYCKFYIRAHLLCKEIKEKKEENLSPRDIDMYLLKYGYDSKNKFIQANKC